MKSYCMKITDTNRDFNVIHYGEEQCSKGYSFGPYVRQNYFLHYVYSGKGIFKVGKTTYQLQRGQIFMIFPGQVTFYKADEDDPWLYRWIEFQGRGVQALLAGTGISKENPIYTEAEPHIAGERLKEILDEGEMSSYKLTGMFWLFADALTEGRNLPNNVSRQEEYVRKVQHMFKHITWRKYP